MNALIWVCLALVTWPNAFALYFEGVKEIFRPPTSLRNNSYFGYSITYDAYYKKLVISAPRTDTIGDVYDCNLEDRGCIAINRSIIKREGMDKYTHDFWFGATVKAGPTFVMMCAPRYTEYTTRKSNNKGFNAFVTRGACYSHSNGTLNKRRTIEETVRIADSPSPMEATMDSFGWSIDVASDDSVIVGGPGMFHGRAMIYNRPELYKPPILIRKSRNTPEFNFGYAVASGAFINADLSFAIGSTYGKHGFGEVLFYKSTTFLKKLDKKVDTKVVGSMFGAVLCSARLVGRRDDLLVGAPTYATKGYYNLGAVYVYLALKLKKSPEFYKKITSKFSGSMFGSAIISVGDLNNDKRDEIAIAAPFENSGQGVVYLYSGADLINPDLTEKTLKPLQKIKPEASYGKSFGMSLTSLLDYDAKGCKDIAIGSPYTDTAVLLRCMASITVKTTATFPNTQGRTKSGREKFDFEVCLIPEYPTLPTEIIARIKTTVEMNHDHAKLDDTKGTGRFIFETDLNDKQAKYCKNVPFILPSTGKYETAIRYMISSELMNDPRGLTDYHKSRVTLSDLSKLSIQDGSYWAAECAGKVCEPKLKMTSSISFKNDYIIGSSKTETMNITVFNTGEVAYASCVKVHIVGINVLKPGGCVYETSTDGDRLICEPSKPLWNDQNTTTGQIELEMTHLTNQDSSITITMLLYDRCNDADAVPQNQTEQITLKADPKGIIAKGETDIGAVVGMKEEDIKENGKSIQHIYTILNHGPTNWLGLSVYVTLPKQPYIYCDNTSVTVYYSTPNSYNPCTVMSEDDTSTNFVCIIESLVTNLEFAKILIPLDIPSGTLTGLLDKDKNITVTSSVKLEVFEKEFKYESITTIVQFQEGTVPIETIIIAVVVGLCFLIIIALILYRVGFLRRKRRDELQKLRKSVKRQTILRRSTMPSQNQRAQDRRQILEGMNEEDEHEQAPNPI